jgi:hypothetical protein
VGSPSIASLINDYVNAFTRWVNDVTELGKLEMSEQGKKAGAGAGLFAGAALFGFFAFVLFTLALGWGLVALGLPAWAAFAIEMVLYLIIAAVLALVGKNLVAQVTGPQRSIAALKAGPGFPLAGHGDGTPGVASPPAG